MGDVRFLPAYQSVRMARDRASAIRALDDEALIAALAGTAMARDEYLANVLATEGQNRVRMAARALDAVPAAVLTLTPEGRVAAANARARALLRPGAEPLGGASVDALAATPEDAQAILAFLDEPLGELPCCLLGPDGRPFAARLSASPVEDARGARVGVTVLIDAEPNERSRRLDAIEDLARGAPAPWDVAPRARPLAWG